MFARSWQWVGHVGLQQTEDVSLVESVQRGMSTLAFTQGRLVCDPGGSGLSEHGLHHFHSLVLDAYRRVATV